VQRTIIIIASVLIPLSTLPLAASAREHGTRTRTERPVVRERAAPRAVREERAMPRPVEARPIVLRETAPREVIREIPRGEFRHVEPRRIVEPRRFVEPRVPAPQRIERRSTFVRYYSPHYFRSAPVRQRVVFRRFVPRRIFVAPPVQIVRTYYARPVYVRTAALPVSYAYRGYMPIYGSSPIVTPVYYNAPVQVPLPIAWTPVSYGSYYDNDGDENGNFGGYNGYNGYNGYPYNGQYNPYAQYPQYPYGAPQYPYANQYPVGYNAPFGMNPFGNAQLQGVVISNTNGGILVLTPDLKPVFVNLSVAQQNGYVSGNIAPGSFVNIFGYNTGNEFIATALS
jgi:hypothetical protein